MALDLDDDHPLPHRKPHAGDIWGVAKWAAVGVSLMLLVLTLVVEKPAQIWFVLGLSFFTLGAARLAQAEQHRYPL